MKRMLTVMAALLLTVGLGAQSGAAKPASKYDGRWLVSTVNGNAVSGMGGGEMILVFTGGKYEQILDSVVSEEGTLTFDLTKTPNHVDLGILTGPDGGKLQRGLVEVTGDTMSLALSAPDADPARPASLTEGTLVVTAIRVK